MARKSIIISISCECEEDLLWRDLQKFWLDLQRFQVSTTFKGVLKAKLLSDGCSKNGTRQILDVKMMLRDGRFWERYRPQSIAYGPSTSSKATCFGNFPENLIEATDTNTEVQLLNLLKEIKLFNEPIAYFFEYFFSQKILGKLAKIRLLGSFLPKTEKQRREDLKRWLVECEHETIMLVVPLGYFKRIVMGCSADDGSAMAARHCDVWLCDLLTTVPATAGGPSPTPEQSTASSSSTRNSRLTEPSQFQFQNPRLLYRTHLSEPFDGSEDTMTNRFDRLPTSGDNSGGTSTTAGAVVDGDDNADGDQVENDLNENEPYCRICHVSRSLLHTM
jgi:hypothetical protein